jgi:hypothetical protein
MRKREKENVSSMLVYDLILVDDEKEKNRDAVKTLSKIFFVTKYNFSF